MSGGIPAPNEPVTILGLADSTVVGSKEVLASVGGATFTIPMSESSSNQWDKGVAILGESTTVGAVNVVENRKLELGFQTKRQ